ncbi:MAG TPA: peptidoglycan DD-metalloendopeptidase family protein [Elusimicrobiales bacterium]|nr:peptidoglycan DD-metalloendopeptidase family protein [Elusimicrobiales bacterium]HPO94991.1 peptidoglycan DD-metalloendopeptidase family protein [Elusimicrobiales bacterium]
MLNNRHPKILVVFSVFVFSLFSLTILYFKNKKIKVEVSDKKFAYFEGNFKTTLEKELRDKKISEYDIRKIINAYSKLKIDFRKLSEKDDYSITLSSSGDFISMHIDRGDLSYSVWKSSSEFLSEKSINSVKISTYAAEGEIKNILWTSMTDKNIPPDIILNFADMFGWEIDFLTEVRDGDKFKVIYSVKENLKGKIIERKVLFGVYDGKETGKKIMAYFDGDYYNEKGEGARSMFLKAPLQYRRISSYFTYKRFHPVLRYVRPHLGIDYAAPSGTPISSVADGVVVYKGWKGGYGNYVEIKHQMGYVSSYGHLSRFASIYVGKRVKQGDLIGYVGASGIATGPHLDFRIKQDGKFINYLKIKRTSNKKLATDKNPLLKEKINFYLNN